MLGKLALLFVVSTVYIVAADDKVKIYDKCLQDKSESHYIACDNQAQVSSNEKQQIKKGEVPTSLKGQKYLACFYDKIHLVKKDTKKGSLDGVKPFVNDLKTCPNKGNGWYDKAIKVIKDCIDKVGLMTSDWEASTAIRKCIRDNSAAPNYN